jgi:TRAP-type C4-dicarboxylate transport system permease small subunit
MNLPQRNAVERAIVGTCTAVLWLTMSVIFTILIINTVLRYTTGSSLQWANEVPELLFPWLVMAGVVMAAVHGSHIATTFLLEVAPPVMRRVVSASAWLVVAGMYALLSVSTYRMLEIVADERSPILQVPGSVTYGCMAGGMVMLAMLALMSAWRAAWGQVPAHPGAADAAAQASVAQG